MRIWATLVVATLTATGSRAAPVANAQNSEEPTVVFSESLGDGRILTRFTNGVTVVATEGTTVVFEAIPGSEREGGTAVGLIPPDYDEVGVLRAAQTYRAMGRSPEKDQQALGYSRSQAQSEARANRELVRAGRLPAGGATRSAAGSGSQGEVYDTGCAEVDSSVFWKGCYRRYRTADNDAKAWYTAEESQGTGHGKGGWYLRTGRTDHRYNKASKVVQWEPSNDVPKGKCEQVGFSLGAYGVSMSRSTTVCPEKISINTNDSNRFYAQWNGAVRADNPGVVAQDFTRVPNGKGPGFEYWVYEYHTVYS